MNVLDQQFGKNWAAYHGDSTEVLKGIPDNSIGCVVYSPPFSQLYVYSASDRDLGNSKDHAEFYDHYRFITQELYRVLMPGRMVAVHCMNLPTSKERDGHIGLSDFRGDLIRIHEADKFLYHSEVCIWKNPVHAMQRTKALGLLHKQVKKDSAMSRQGIPDYLVAFRKPGLNPHPVEGVLDVYTGEMSEEEFETWCRQTYNMQARRDQMPYSEFKSIQIWQRYASPVWDDINPSITLQKESAREDRDERHIAPLQLQVIERAVRLWSNLGDTVLSPFAGIGSEGYVAIKTARKFVGVELKPSYYGQMLRNLTAAEVMAGQLAMFQEEEVA